MVVGQAGPKTVEEIEKAVLNYQVIIEEADRLDPSYECSRTQDIFDAIFKFYVPTLTTEVESLMIPKSRKDSVNKSISSLCELKLAKDIKDIEHVDSKKNSEENSNNSHESPMIHLLYLAVEKKGISCSREQSPEGKNWGRLAAISEYLAKLTFKDWVDDYGAPYWPGLPTCIMVYVPVLTSQPSLDIAFSATPDKFVYALATQKKFCAIRAARFRRLERRCNADTKKRIDAIKLFSKELGDQSKWKTLFKPVSDSTEFGVHNWRPHHLKPHASIPFYLPVVTSTWYPNGKYLRACALDSLRFAVLRPPEAQKVEESQRYIAQKKPGKSHIPTETGCAEWDGFLEMMSRLQDTNTVFY